MRMNCAPSKTELLDTNAWSQSLPRHLLRRLANAFQCDFPEN